MTDTVIARRYANALFSIGKQSGLEDLEKYGENLANLEACVVNTPVLDKVFKSPVVTVQEKKSVIKKVLSEMGADTMLTNFCLLLADKNRLSTLKDISNIYGELLDKEKGILRGTLVTAISLDTKKKNAIKKQLEEKAGKNIYLDFSVDKSILGGVVLHVGDRVLDASLRAQLAVLRKTIKRGE